ncbi:MAG: CDP-alcohol phosphatidyltransferase family protein [Bifidobacteriaceae bacterium]|jgi:CDP-diacylglycerol--glycerol-3-phosphate 3-phosphatidyltransferase|nr:CDP-alcohol phosphatidyltransferase family protein [Bifidobacteriaceae bacterium]
MESGHRRPGLRELTVGGARVANWPNLITVVRTAAAIALGAVALRLGSVPLLIAAYATYWVGDIADGRVARWLRQETRLGAVFDILADRGCSSLCIATLIVIRPEFTPALAVYWVQFMVVDALLSCAFLHWPILSPNYFYKVDRTIYLWNWSPPAKAANTGLLLLVLLTLPPWVGLALACAQLVLKLVSAWRVAALATVRT